MSGNVSVQILQGERSNIAIYALKYCHVRSVPTFRSGSVSLSMFFFPEAESCRMIKDERKPE